MIIVVAADENRGVSAKAAATGDFDAGLAGKQIVNGGIGTGCTDFGAVDDADVSEYFIGALCLAGGGDNDGVECGEQFNGAYDDLRITKGVCRYTNTFTPPSAPFDRP